MMLFSGTNGFAVSCFVSVGLLSSVFLSIRSAMVVCMIVLMYQYSNFAISVRILFLIALTCIDEQKSRSVLLMNPGLPLY